MSGASLPNLKSDTANNQSEDTAFSQNFHPLQVNIFSPNELDNKLKDLTPDQREVFFLLSEHFFARL